MVRWEVVIHTPDTVGCTWVAGSIRTRYAPHPSNSWAKSKLSCRYTNRRILRSWIRLVKTRATKRIKPVAAKAPTKCATSAEVTRTAPLFFCMVVTLSVVTSPNWVHLSRFFRDGWGKVLKGSDWELKLAILTTIALYLQHVLGATVRHSGTVNGTKGAVLVTSALVAHLAGALVATGLILFVARVFTKRIHDRSILRLVYLQLSLLFAQLLLGLGAYLVRIDPANQVQPTVSRVWITTSHLTIGVLLLVTSLVVTLRLMHNVALRDREPVPEPTLAGQIV